MMTIERGRGVGIAASAFCDGSGAQRQRHHEFRTVPESFVAPGHGPSVQMNQPLQERQPESEPAGLPGRTVIHLREGLEQPIQLRGPDPNPAVAQPDLGPAEDGAHDEGGHAPGRRELRGVVEQVADHLGEAGWVSVHEHRPSRTDETQLDAALVAARRGWRQRSRRPRQTGRHARRGRRPRSVPPPADCSTRPRNRLAFAIAEFRARALPEPIGEAALQVCLVGLRKTAAQIFLHHCDADISHLKGIEQAVADRSRAVALTLRR